jgi:hypothetical protein
MRPHEGDGVLAVLTYMYRQIKGLLAHCRLTYGENGTGYEHGTDDVAESPS